MQQKAAILRGVRDKAHATGDHALAAAMTADLERMGIRDPTPVAGFETAIPEPLETAVPRKGGRPRRPRCEHGNIVGRCGECDHDAAD